MIHPDSGHPFVVGKTDLREFSGHPLRLSGGAILLCTQGSAKVMVNLEEFGIGVDTEIHLLPGSVLILSEVAPSFQAIFFSFTRLLFDEATHRLEAPFFHFLKNNPVYHHQEKSAPVIRKRLEMAEDIYLDMENRFRLILARNCLQNILLNVYDKSERHFIRSRQEGYTRREELFHKFIQLILQHCTKERDVAYYAGRLCISKSYLASVSRSITGETPKEVIDKHIVQELKILLASTDYPVQQIADLLHFPDQSYLGRYFKRHTGQSPVEYRSIYEKG